LTEGAQDTGETTANAGILTVVGTVMGTPDYISPEQARDAGSADGRSDIYSLGATLYFLLAGRPPFSDGSVADRLLSHAQQTPRPIDVMRTDIPAGLAHVLGRMLAKNPRDRFQTAAEVAEALEAFSEAGRRNAARRRFVLGRNLALAALFLISVAFAAILYITTDQGTLIINSSSDDVDVVIRQGGREVRIVDVVTGSTVVRLPSDEYEVSLKGDQNKFTLDTNPFVLTRGSDQIVTIRMQPDGPFALPTPENAFINSIGMRLVPVPPGEFTMGAATPETEFTTREQPHTVRITKPFSIGVCEVTQQQYHQVMGHNPSAFSAAGLLNDKVQGLDTGHFPVDSVSWLDAVEFCRRLSDVPAERNAGLVYRLPLEAEWEYACRAATTTPFYYGDGLNQGLANTSGDDPTGHAEPSALQRTTLVGSYPPNALGLHDMHGNVWEWCADWYDLDYYATSPASDPPGPDAPGAEREGRVIRGGAWRYPDRYARSASRDNRDPAGGDVDLGFRVVCERAEGRDHAVAALAAIAAIQEAGGRLKFNDDNVVVNVSFNSSDVDDAGLACLSGLNQLESLYLPGTSVTDAGIEQHIKGLTGLRNLYLPGTNVTDAGMQHLAELPRLVVLYVDRTALTDAGLKHLANLELLVTLSLNGTAVTNAGLAEIEGLNHLAFLHLKDTAVTDAGLQRLTGLERLVTLDLDRTQTTDAGLEHLAKLTNLQTLGLAGTQVTDEGVAKLQQALPNCSVSR
jgi:formylglycine-generating enzyme required for sulfatase activity